MSNKLKYFLGKMKDPKRADEVARSLGYANAQAVMGATFPEPRAAVQGAHVPAEDDMQAQILEDRKNLGLTTKAPGAAHQDSEDVDGVPMTAEAVRQQINRDRRELGLQAI